MHGGCVRVPCFHEEIDGAAPQTLNHASFLECKEFSCRRAGMCDKTEHCILNVTRASGEGPATNRLNCLHAMFFDHVRCCFVTELLLEEHAFFTRSTKSCEMRLAISLQRSCYCYQWNDEHLNN